MPIIPGGSGSPLQLGNLFNQSITVQQIMDYCSLHTKLQNFFNVGGLSLEPGLTICNQVNQQLLARPFKWKFNRVELTGGPNGTGNFFVTQFGIQDYKFGGASAFVLFNNQNLIGTQPNTANLGGGVGIDLAVNPMNGGTAGITVAAGTVTVQTLDTHPFQVGQTVFMTGNTVAAYNSTWTYNAPAQTSSWTGGFVITAVPDITHFQFVALGGQTVSSGAPGITNWGWGDSAFLYDINSNSFPQPVFKIEMVDRNTLTYMANDPDQVAMMVDYNNGVLKFRLSNPNGGYSWMVNIVYQARAPKLTTPQSVFQWKDNLSYVLQEVALGYAYRFATGLTSEDTKMQIQLANQAIMSAQMAEDSEANNEGFIPQSFLKW